MLYITYKTLFLHLIHQSPVVTLSYLYVWALFKRLVWFKWRSPDCLKARGVVLLRVPCVIHREQKGHTEYSLSRAAQRAC